MFKVAVLGYRNQASRHYAPVFDRLPDCQIVEVCDIVEERAREGGDWYGVPAYTQRQLKLRFFFYDGPLACLILTLG